MPDSRTSVKRPHGQRTQRIRNETEVFDDHHLCAVRHRHSRGLLASMLKGMQPVHQERGYRHSRN
jgi:hypothetical protein